MSLYLPLKQYISLVKKSSDSLCIKIYYCMFFEFTFETSGNFVTSRSILVRKIVLVIVKMATTLKLTCNFTLN